MNQRFFRPAALLTAAIILLSACLLARPLPAFSASPAAPELKEPVLASVTEVHPTFTRVITYRYNARGQRIQEHWNGGTVTIEYQYHENGNLLSETKYTQNHILRTTEYRFDGTRCRETENTYYENGGLSSTKTTLYDEKGNPLSWRRVDADGTNHDAILYTNEYDRQDRLVRQETRREDGTLLHVDTWDYHDSGYILDCTEYNGDPENNPVWVHEVHSFDADGKIRSVLRDVMDSAPCHHLQNYTYDARGNLTEEVWNVYDVDSKDFSRSTVTSQNTYAGGRLVRRETRHSDLWCYDGQTTETPPELSGTEIWEYDKDGRLISHDDGSTICAYSYLPLERILGYRGNPPE